MFPFLSTPTLYSPIFAHPPPHPACVLVCSRFLDLSNWEMERKRLLDEEDLTSRSKKITGGFLSMPGNPPSAMNYIGWPAVTCLTGFQFV